jgi:hypothetical protein
MSRERELRRERSDHEEITMNSIVVTEYCSAPELSISSFSLPLAIRD